MYINDKNEIVVERPMELREALQQRERVVTIDNNWRTWWLRQQLKMFMWAQNLEKRYAQH